MAGKKMPIIVSHFTKDTGYEKEVRHLERSLKKFKLNYTRNYQIPGNRKSNYFRL